VAGELPAEPVGTVERVAVRAVVRVGAELLMIRSEVAGDYKFPGGGVEAGESPAEALVREVREECGLAVVHVGDVPVIIVEELRAGLEAGWVLSMRSSYLPCDVDREERHPTVLEAYEAALGFVPEWVTVDHALRVNEEVLARGGASPWVERETLVLRVLCGGSYVPDESP
jgi:ADP-ribose pyrophosphatase YjhB (NUDIX family)